MSISPHAWADVAYLLIEFAMKSPVWVLVLFVVPTLAILGLLTWFLNFMGAKRIARLGRQYLNRISRNTQNKTPPNSDEEG